MFTLDYRRLKKEKMYCFEYKQAVEEKIADLINLIVKLWSQLITWLFNFNLHKILLNKVSSLKIKISMYICHVCVVSENSILKFILSHTSL